VLGTLYRYPHPLDATKFIYCGQGPKRDKAHHLGRTSYGRRFKKNFPDTELPQPIREEIEVVDGVHLNHLETAWMLLYQTLRSIHDGMNLTLPGSHDYEIMGNIGGPIGGSISGPGNGRKNVESGHLARICTKEVQSKGGRTQGRNAAAIPGHMAKAGRISGLKSVESGHLASIQTKENQSKGRCKRWNVDRDKPCTCGRHTQYDEGKA
jgi:hypothetical protein